MKVEKLPPHSVEAEEGLLGSIAVDPDAIHEVDLLHGADFYSSYNGKLFDTMRQMVSDDVMPDTITLTQWMPDFNTAHFVGLLMEATTASRIKEYGKIIRETSHRRKVISAAGRIAKEAWAVDNSLSDVLETAATELIAVSVDDAVPSAKSARELALEALGIIEERRAAGGNVIGLLSGIAELDMILRGIKAPGLYVIAARPGLGKTAFVTDIIYNILRKDNNKRGVFFTLEMFAEQIIMRMISQQSGIPFDDVNEGNFTSADGDLKMEKVMAATGKVSTLDLLVDDTPSITVGQIYARCQREIAKNGRIDFIAIDYLQLMGAGDEDNRTRAIGQITQDLKILAKRLRIPVILLSQLSRGLENRKNKRPILSDLRDSGEIEQNADVVIFLYRESYYSQPGDEPDDNEYDYGDDENVAEVNVAKNRLGKQGMVRVFQDEATRHFASLVSDERHL